MAVISGLTSRYISKNIIDIMIKDGNTIVSKAPGSSILVFISIYLKGTFNTSK